MRNLKKLLAVIVSVCVLATFALPAFAAETTTLTDAQISEKLGAVKGDTSQGVTEEYLAKGTTRLQAAIIYLRMLNLEEEALAFESEDNFADAADVPWAGGRAILAYLKANPELGWQGVSETTFEPNGAASAQMMYKVALEALGYKQGTDFEWADVFTFAEDKGLGKAADLAELTNNDMCTIVVEMLGIKVKDGDVTLIEKLVADGVIAEADAIEVGLIAAEPEELEVVDVTAENLIEVVVEFNRAVDKDTAEDEDNYDIDDVTIDEAKLQDDGKTVVLTLDPTDFLDNDADYTLEIDKALVKAEVEFNAYDFTVPTADSIELTGPDSFEIKFSEPISSANSTVEVEIDDGVYAGTVTVNNTRTVKVEMGVSSLEEGEYKVVVSGAEDFAEYTAPKKTFTLDYARDDSVPTAKITDIDRTEVKIEWNVEVEGADGGVIDENYFYHSYKSYNPDSVTRDGKKMTLDFTSNPLPEGNVKIVVEYDAVDDEEITSVWGVELAGDLILTGTVVDDTTKPEVEKIEADDEKNIIIYFNEGMDRDSAQDEDNYVIKKDGKDLDNDFTAAYDSDDEAVTLTFEDELSGDYTIEISGVKDDALEGNKIAKITLKFTVKDVTGVDLENDVTVEATEGSGTDDDVIIVRFGDDMSGTGDYSVLNKDNYQIQFNGESKWNSLGDKDKIAFFGGNKAVKITLNDNPGVVIGGQLRIGRVEDAAGNKSDLLSHDLLIGTIAGKTADSAIMKTWKTIEIKYEDTVVTAAPVNAFTVAGGTPAGVKISRDGDDSILTLTLKAGYGQLDDDDATELADGDLTIEVIANKVKFDTGVFATAEAAIPVTDGIAPEITSIEQNVGTTDELLVTFSEPVDVTTEELAATDFVIVNEDGDTLVPGVDFTIDDDTPDDDELVIKLTDAVDADNDQFKVDTVDAIRYIFDADGEGEKVKAYGDAKKITLDFTGPKASVTGAGDNNDADYLVITFNEALYAGTTELENDDDVSAYFVKTGTVTVDSAIYNATAKTVTLELSGAVADDIITMTGINDAVGNLIDTDTDVAKFDGTVWTLE